MPEGFKIGAYSTDTMTGKVVKIIGTLGFGALNTGVGVDCYLAAAAYTVTAGKVFHCTGFEIMFSDAFTANSYLHVRYADNAVGTTNPVTMFQLPVPIGPATMYAAVTVFPVGNIQVPAGKYVVVFNASGTNQAVAGAYSVTLFGYEA
jgi:hypothetical protein